MGGGGHFPVPVIGHDPKDAARRLARWDNIMRGEDFEEFYLGRASELGQSQELSGFGRKGPSLSEVNKSEFDLLVAEQSDQIDHHDMLGW